MDLRKEPEEELGENNINFFSVSCEKRIVDLPGYGYARVSSAISASWRKNLFPHNDYLTISEKPAWKFLKKMHQEDLKEFHQ